MAQQPPSVPPPPSPQPPMGLPPAAPGPGAWQAPPTEPGPAPGVRFAGHGGRLIAYIVDGILQFAIWLLITIVLGLIGIGAAAVGAVAIAGATLLVWFLVWIAISVLYFPYFWVNGGATPGMRLFGLRVVRDADGGPVGWTAAIVRWIGYLIDSIVFGLPIGFLWILIDSRRRGWHDLIAGTVVIEG